MRANAVPPFGRKRAALFDQPPKTGAGLVVRYRQSPLQSLITAGIFVFASCTIVYFVLNPAEMHDTGRATLIGSLEAFPIEVRPYILSVIGIIVLGGFLLKLIRVSDDKPDFILDRHGIADVGLLVRRRVPWEEVSHVVIDRRWYQRPYLWKSTMHFYLEPGAAPRVEELVPGLSLLRFEFRPRMSIPLSVSEASEEEILAAARSYKPGIRAQDLV